MLRLWMQNPHAPFELVPTQDKFKSYLQWHINRSFYYDWGSGDASGSGAPESQMEDEEE